jgi:hypothetical protein
MMRVREDAMPAFMKVDGIDSVGREESVNDRPSNKSLTFTDEQGNMQLPEPDGILKYDGGDTLTPATGHDSPVPEFVDDVVGPSTSGGTSVLEFSVENFPNNSSGDGSFHGFGIDRGHLGFLYDFDLMI